MTEKQKIKRVKQLVNRYEISEEEASFYVEMSELIPVNEDGTVRGRDKKHFYVVNPLIYNSGSSFEDLHSIWTKLLKE